MMLKKLTLLLFPLLLLPQITYSMTAPQIKAKEAQANTAIQNQQWERARAFIQDLNAAGQKKLVAQLRAKLESAQKEQARQQTEQERVVRIGTQQRLAQEQRALVEEQQRRQQAEALAQRRQQELGQRQAEIDRLVAETLNNVRRIGAADRDKRNLEDQLRRIETNYRENQHLAEEAYNTCMELLDDCTQRRNVLQEENRVLKEADAAQKELVRQLEKQLEDLVTGVEQKDVVCANHIEQIKKLEQDREKLVKECDDAKKALQDKLNQANKENIDLKQNKDALQKEKNVLESTRAGLQKRIDDATAHINQLNSTHKTEIQSLERQLQVMKEKAEKFESEYEKMKDAQDQRWRAEEEAKTAKELAAKAEQEAQKAKQDCADQISAAKKDILDQVKALTINNKNLFNDDQDYGTFSDKLRNQIKL